MTFGSAAVEPSVRGIWGVVALALGCSASETAAPPVASCGENCPATFDACPEGQLPKLGGGCAVVGVPAEGCGPGLPSDGAGGCVSPIACAASSFASPGEAACHPVACGDVPTSGVFVDATFTGTSDGSRERPFTAIQPAIDAAPDGGTVIVEAGTYTGSIRIAKQLALVGRCADKVTIVGTDRQAIDATGEATIRNVTITGSGIGVQVDRTKAATIRDVFLRELGGPAIQIDSAYGMPDVTIEDVLVERASYIAIWVVGARATIARTTVRDTRPSATKSPALGASFIAERNPLTKKPAVLTVRDTVFERATELGAGALGANVTFERTTIRDTKSNRSGLRGHGLLVQETDRTPGDVTATGLIVERNVDLGVSVEGPAKLTLDRSVIRETAPRRSGKLFGTGLQTYKGDIVIRDTLIAKNHLAGISAKTATLVLERSVVRDTAGSAADGRAGMGIVIAPFSETEAGSTVSILDSLFLRNHTVGISAIGSAVTIERSAVLDTMPEESDGLFGDGIVAHSFATEAMTEVRGSVSIRESLVRGSARAGVATFGADVKLATSALTCNRIDLDVEEFEGLVASLADEGRNACGCSGEVLVCRAQSNNLQPAPKL